MGLTIGLDQPLMLREQRYSRMRAAKSAGYVDPEKVEDEVIFANRICRDGGFAMIDVTDAPIESTADRIIRLMAPRFPQPASD